MESNNDCQFSLAELMNQITEELPHKRTRTVKSKLKLKNGDSITITEIQNRTSVVLFRGIRDKILTEFWYNSRKGTSEEERMQIVQTAAAIIKEDIKYVVGSTQIYPSSDRFLNEVNKDIPQTLQSFFRPLLSRKKQKAENKRKNKHKDHIHSSCYNEKCTDSNY